MPAAKKKTKPHLSVEVTENQLEAWNNAAEADGGRSLSSWVRAVLDRVAGKKRSA